MWGGPLDVFLKVELRIGRSPNLGTAGGQKSSLPIDKTHRLYSSWDISSVQYQHLNQVIVCTDDYEYRLSRRGDKAHAFSQTKQKRFPQSISAQR